MPSSATSEFPINIAICGGGLGGLALAVGLLRHSHVKVHIYEAAHAFAEIGAGVSFGPNSRRAMSMIDEELVKGYERTETINMWAEKRDTYFDFRVGMSKEEERGMRPGQSFCEVKHEGVVASSCVHRVSCTSYYELSFGD